MLASAQALRRSVRPRRAVQRREPLTAPVPAAAPAQGLGLMQTLARLARRVPAAAKHRGGIGTWRGCRRRAETARAGTTRERSSLLGVGEPARAWSRRDRAAAGMRCNGIPRRPARGAKATATANSDDSSSARSGDRRHGGGSGDGKSASARCRRGSNTVSRAGRRCLVRGTTRPSTHRGPTQNRRSCGWEGVCLRRCRAPPPPPPPPRRTKVQPAWTAWQRRGHRALGVSMNGGIVPALRQLTAWRLPVRAAGRTAPALPPCHNLRRSQCSRRARGWICRVVRLPRPTTRMREQPLWWLARVSLVARTPNVVCHDMLPQEHRHHRTKSGLTWTRTRARARALYRTRTTTPKRHAGCGTRSASISFVACCLRVRSWSTIQLLSADT